MAPTADSLHEEKANQWWFCRYQLQVKHRNQQKYWGLLVCELAYYQGGYQPTSGTRWMLCRWLECDHSKRSSIDGSVVSAGGHWIKSSKALSCCQEEDWTHKTCFWWDPCIKRHVRVVCRSMSKCITSPWPQGYSRGCLGWWVHWNART